MTQIPTKEQVAANPNLLFDNAPPKPVSMEPVEVMVVGRRCVYLNNHRIAGGKPYVSENLPTHEFTTSLDEILSAFSEADIRAALREREKHRNYLKEYHAQ